MAVLLTDDFNRANSTTSIGSPTTGGPYTVRVGTWGINSNQAYSPSGTANGHVTFPAAVNVDLQVKVPILAASAGLIARWTSTTNFYGLIYNSSRWALMQNINGTLNILLYGPTANNADYIRLVAFDKVLYGFAGATSTPTFFGAVDVASSTATAAGISAASGSARLDDLSAADATAIPSSVQGSTAVAADPIRVGITLGAGFVYKGRDTKTQDTGAVA